MQTPNFDIPNIYKYFEYVKNDEEFQYEDNEIDLITIHIFEDGVNKIENVKVIEIFNALSDYF